MSTEQTQPRAIQEIFNAVINSGYYALEGCRYMCPALLSANRHKVITDDEYRIAIYAIEEYLGRTYDTLSFKLVAVFDIPLEERFKKCMEIYRNWENRP